MKQLTVDGKPPKPADKELARAAAAVMQAWNLWIESEEDEGFDEVVDALRLMNEVLDDPRYGLAAYRDPPRYTND